MRGASGGSSSGGRAERWGRNNWTQRRESWEKGDPHCPLILTSTFFFPPERILTFYRLWYVNWLRLGCVVWTVECTSWVHDMHYPFIFAVQLSCHIKSHPDTSTIGSATLIETDPFNRPLPYPFVTRFLNTLPQRITDRSYLRISSVYKNLQNFFKFS